MFFAFNDTSDFNCRYEQLTLTNTLTIGSGVRSDSLTVSYSTKSNTANAVVITFTTGATLTWLSNIMAYTVSKSNYQVNSFTLTVQAAANSAV